MTELEAITLGTAILGAVTGSGALAWSVSQHWLTGPRISVSIQQARIGAGGAITGGKAWEIDEPGYPMKALAVEVINKGRHATTISQVGVAFAGGISFRHIANFGGGPQLPMRMEGQTGETWYVDFDAALATVAASRSALGITDRRARGRVGLATGKVKSSKNAITIPD